MVVYLSKSSVLWIYQLNLKILILLKKQKQNKHTQSIAHTCEENLYDKSLYSLSGASEIKNKWICY